MSISDKYRPQFTYDDYCIWEGRWELIDGMPYAMSPSPVRKHQLVSGNLFSIIKRALESSCSHCEAYQQLDWKINDKTVVQPDLFIVCDSFTEDFLTFPPSLIIESCLHLPPLKTVMKSLNSMKNKAYNTT